MKNIFYFLLLILWGSSLIGAEHNCRKAMNVDSDVKGYFREVFIIIDQTTSFNKELQEEIIHNTIALAEIGTQIFIYKFSEYSKNNYMKLVKSIKFDKSISEKEEDSIKKSQIKKLSKCLKNQTFDNKKQIYFLMKSTFKTKGNNATSSNILTSLQKINEQSIQNSGAKEKIIILASDMLEHSIYTSFYKNNRMKKIDVNKEIKIVKEEYLDTDYEGSYVYVIGAGILGISSSNARDDRKIRALKRFWQTYFKLSNAKLDGFYETTMGRNISEINRDSIK